jgi:hypothetical protein
MKEIADAMFRYRNNWINITTSEKEKWFFIFNRYFSKKYPELSQLLNYKNISKEDGMDIIYSFFENKPYPNWFWSKSDSKSSIDKIDKLDLELMKEHQISQDDLVIIKEFYNDDYKEEIKKIKNKK